MNTASVIRFGWLSWVALLAAVAACVVLARGLWRLGASELLADPSADAETALVDRQRAEARAAEIETYLAQIDGRSLILTPPRPTPPPPPPVDDGPRESPPPAFYRGPDIIATVNGVAWFDDGRRLAPGEADGDLELESLLAPWEAVVLWQGRRFSVEFFPRDHLVLHEANRGPTGPPPPAEPHPDAAPEAAATEPGQIPPDETAPPDVISEENGQ